VLLFFSTSLTFAQEEIIVKSFGPGRTSHPIVNSSGNLPTPPLFSPNIFYNQLKNQNNFGANGIVSCEVDLQGSVTSISEGSLVDSQGNLLADVFFAPPINTNLTGEEAEELARFVVNGGVLYVSGSSFPRVQGENLGTEYNPLFEKLGIADRFNPSYEPIDGLVQSGVPVESIITKGIFGAVGPLKHGLYRRFESQYLTRIVPTENSGFIIHEGKMGRGYLVVTGDVLYGNTLVQDPDNMKYYLNFFALGCDKSWQDNSVVLPVPSFKQGLVPYDGIDPVWENQIYDNAETSLPFCDIDKNGATMAECACALTSASMVMKYLKVDLAPDGTNINPEIINNYFKQGSRGFSGPNFRWDFVGNFSSYANQLYPDQPKIEQPVREDYSLERVKELIDEGTPVILRVNNGSHWLVVKGYDPDTNKLIINDPVRPDPPEGEYAYLDDYYTPDTTGSMIVYKTTNSDYRYLQFATASQNHLLVEDELGNKTGLDPASGQIVKEIPNSDYALDPYYASPVIEGAVPTSDGIYFLTIKLPGDGKYKLQVMSQDGEANQVTVYSSDIEGKLTSKEIDPSITGKNYEFNYSEVSAGEVINVSIEAQIDIVPFVSSNIVIPHKWVPVPVAVLASDLFDVTKVIRTSLTFGKTGEEASLVSCSSKLVDVNRDKKKDLICYFYGDKTALDIGDTQAVLKGDYENVSFEGIDSVRVLKPWFLF